MSGCEPISLHDMSRVAYLSTFHFNRVFHQITGLPPAKFISAMRLDEAKRLLLNTNQSITDICFEVGYNSLSTFTRRFTQRVGLGPREFRYLAERITPLLSNHFAPTTRTDEAQRFARRLRVSSTRQNSAGRSSSVSFRAHTAESSCRWRSANVARRLRIGRFPTELITSPPPAAPRRHAWLLIT